MMSTDAVRAAALPSRFVHPSPVHFDELDASLNPDQFHVVREVQVEFLTPFRGLGHLQVELWVEKLGETSCVYGFECSSETGVHARGRRTVVKLEPASLRPARWTERFREAHAGLRRAGNA